MKYVGTERFSPVLYEGDVPWEYDYFHVSPDVITTELLEKGDFLIDDEWWWKQRKRCLEGYTVRNATDTNLDVWIPGRYYFFLNFWQIRGLDKKTKKKKIIKPRFVDMQLELFFLVRERMIQEEKNNQWQKARQRGFSEMAGCDLGYEYTFFPGSQGVIVAGEEKYSDNLWNFTIRGLDALVNTQFYKERAVNQYGYIKSLNTGSEIYSFTAKNNPQVVSSKSPSLIYFEEVGIWKKDMVEATYRYVEPSLKAEGVKTGYACFIGTGGEADEGVADAEEMFYNPDDYDNLTFENKFEKDDTTDVDVGCFVPAYFMEIMDDDGNSLIDESVALLNKERQSKSVSKRYKVISLKPFHPSESFFSKIGGFFGMAVGQWCNERKAYINSHKSEQLVVRGRLEWKNPTKKHEGVIWYPDDEGPFQILEHPKKDKAGNVYQGLYKAATDSYDQDEALTSTSKGACWIKKSFLNAEETYNQYVAGVVERPRIDEGGADKFYEYSALLCVYYNAVNLIEYSKIRIFDWYHDNGLTYLLKERPEFVTAAFVENSNTSNKYGIDPNTKIHWLKMHHEWLQDKENIDNCYFTDLLDAWSRFKYDRKYNCDITIATSLCTVLMEDEKEMLVTESVEEKEKFKYYRRNEFGQIEAVYK